MKLDGIKECDGGHRHSLDKSASQESDEGQWDHEWMERRREEQAGGGGHLIYRGSFDRTRG